MDLDWLSAIVKLDDEGMYPSAERCLRFILGTDYQTWKHHSNSTRRKPLRPSINDPAGLIRSLRSTTTASLQTTSAQHAR